MEILNRKIIFVGLIITLILIIIPFGKIRLKKDSIIVANTKYAKKLPKYKKLMIIYRFSIFFIILTFLGSMMVSFFLIARLIKVDVQIHEEYNRDIFLCMDVSGSMYHLNYEIAQNFKETVKKLDGDRVGILIFDSSSVLLSPLTDDYGFINTVLDKIAEASDLDNYKNMGKQSYIQNGTNLGNGSSFVGDGLTSCVNIFANTDKSNLDLMSEDRTRIIILSTDNMAGRGLFTLEEAAKYAKEKNIIVHGISPGNNTTILSTQQIEFQNAVKSTGGKLYLNNNNSSVAKIIQEIESTNKSILKSEKEITKVDLPEYSFSYLLLSFGLYTLFCRKVKI